MTVLAERNKEGIVRLANGAQIKVPKDRSMLGFIGREFFDGGVYEEDGWIYMDGKKFKKWFITLEDKRVWEPVLHDLAKLEARRFKVATRSQKVIREMWDEGVKQLRKVGTSIIKREQGWWEIKYDKRDDTIRSGWVWCDEPQPKRQRNIEAGKAYMRCEKIIHRYSGYQRFFNAVFLRAVNLFVSNYNIIKTGPWDRQRYLMLTINGREYWFDLNRGIHPLFYPEEVGETVTKVIVD